MEIWQPEKVLRQPLRRLVSSPRPNFVAYLSVDKRIQNEPTAYLLDYIREHIKEDFLLNVDCDELLYLDKTRFHNIKDFLLKRPGHFYVFNWLNVPCYSLFSYSMLDVLLSGHTPVFFSNTCKTLGRTRDIRGISWHHMNNQEQSQRIDGQTERCFVIHFIVRSISHQLLKQAHQYMGNFKDKNNANLKNFLLSIAGERPTLKDYPFRLLAAMTLKLLSQERNVRGELIGLLQHIQTTPLERQANKQRIHENFLALLRAHAPDRFSSSRLNSKNINSMLSEELAIAEKMDSALLAPYFSQVQTDQELRLIMDEIYKHLPT